MAEARNPAGAAAFLALAALTACAERAPTARPATAAAAPPPHVLIASVTPGDAAPPPAEGRSNRTARTVGWVGVAIGADAALVAVATSFMMLHYKSARDAGCDASKVCSGDGFNANKSLDALTWWNVGAFGVAAAGLGAGAILLLTNPREREPGAAMVVAPNGSGASLAVRGAF
jgi:hypothetical protein